MSLIIRGFRIMSQKRHVAVMDVFVACPYSGFRLPGSFLSRYLIRDLPGLGHQVNLNYQAKKKTSNTRGPKD